MRLYPDTGACVFKRSKLSLIDKTKIPHCSIHTSYHIYIYENIILTSCLYWAILGDTLICEFLLAHAPLNSYFESKKYRKISSFRLQAHVLIWGVIWYKSSETPKPFADASKLFLWVNNQRNFDEEIKYRENSMINLHHSNQLGKLI